MLFDRGYPSADLIVWLLAHHIRFVMRVSQGFYPEVYDTTEDNAVVSIGSRPNGRGVSREKELPYAEALPLYFGRTRIPRIDLILDGAKA